MIFLTINNLEQYINIDLCSWQYINFYLEKFIYKNTKNINSIVQIRDPRDILVPEYILFGSTNPDSH